MNTIEKTLYMAYGLFTAHRLESGWKKLTKLRKRTECSMTPDAALKIQLLKIRVDYLTERHSILAAQIEHPEQIAI